MASTSLPFQYYQPYQYQGGTVPYSNTKDPVKAAQNQRAITESQANQYMGTDDALANEYLNQQGATQQYLNPIEANQAQGNGGYNPSEASQIELTPQQEQDIKTNAGISAGVGNAAAVGGAERAAAAAGGSPAALSTYRARAAQSQAANAGQAETGAEVAAQQAGSAGAQAVGNARLNQQGQAEQYFGNLQSEQGGQGQSEQGLSQGAFQTGVQGTGQATGQQVDAAKLPTTTDKIIGGIAGAASAFLADGDSYLDGGQDAVVGEDGPEAVVKAASDPDRSNTKFMDNGGFGGGGTSSGMPSWLQQYLTSVRQQPAAPAATPQGQWNKTTPYNQIGSTVGGIAKKIMQSGNGSGFPGGSGPTGPSVNPNTVNWGAGPSSAPGPSTLPGGLINRTGDTIDGVPSLGGAAADTSSYLGDAGSGIGDAVGGVADAAGDAGAAVGDLAGDAAGLFADGKMPHLAGGRTMEPGFHWPRETRPSAPRTPQGGYQPLGYRAKPMLADGNFPEAPSFNSDTVQTPLQAQPSMQNNSGKPQIFTRPTMVRLQKEEMVVPLSYRPKAKVRPSMAFGGARG